MRIIEGATFQNRKETKGNSSSCTIVSHNQTWPTRSSQKLVRPTSFLILSHVWLFGAPLSYFYGDMWPCSLSSTVGQLSLAVGRFEFGKTLHIPHLLQPLLPHFVICVSHENPNRRSGSWGFILTPAIQVWAGSWTWINAKIVEGYRWLSCKFSTYLCIVNVRHGLNDHRSTYWAIPA